MYIDGQKVETFMIGNCQLGVSATAGSHTVEYSYTPKGALIGGAISVATLLGFATLKLLEKRKKLLQIDSSSSDN